MLNLKRGAIVEFEATVNWYRKKGNAIDYELTKLKRIKVCSR